jgi:hypothetical protein
LEIIAAFRKTGQFLKQQTPEKALSIISGKLNRIPPDFKQMK